VDDFPRRPDGAAVGFAQGLMTEADAEDGHRPRASLMRSMRQPASWGRPAPGEHQHGVPFAGVDLLHDAARRQLR
jgi:hypothetical protein